MVYRADRGDLGQTANHRDYLNVVEAGISTYGVEAGTVLYFNHPAAKLTPTEVGRIGVAIEDGPAAPALT